MAQVGDLTFRVTPDGGEPYEVIADSRDVRLWERVSTRNSLRRIAEDPSFDDYYSLVHIAIKRQRLREVPPFAEFVETNAVLPTTGTVGTTVPLDRNELMDVLDKAMAYEDTSVGFVADAVMDLLEELPGRPPDPTQPGRSPGT